MPRRSKLHGESEEPDSSSRTISDSSPLVHFARIGEFELIQKVFSEILVPQAVWREVVEDGRSRPGSREMASASWVRRVTIVESPLVLQLRYQFDPGESEAIALAIEYSGALPLILDERRARRIARSRNLVVIGSAGLLISAKERGILSVIEPTLMRLVASGLRLSDQVIAEVLESANER